MSLVTSKSINFQEYKMQKYTYIRKNLLSGENKVLSILCISRIEFITKLKTWNEIGCKNGKKVWVYCEAISNQ